MAISVITLAMVQTRLTAAFDARAAGVLSYTGPDNRVVQFDNLKALQEHIDWLMALEASLQGQADATSQSADAYAPTVQFEEPS